MKTNASNPASGGWILVCVGLLWFLFAIVLGFNNFSKWRTETQLNAHGLITDAVIDSVEVVRGEKGNSSYRIGYTFNPPGQPQQNGEVSLGLAAATELLGRYPGYSLGWNLPTKVCYLPEDPSRNRLEGRKSATSPLLGFLLGFLFWGVFVAAAVALMVTEVRMSRPDPPLSALPSKENLQQSERTIHLGSLTYTPQPQQAVFRPSLLMSVGMLVLGGGFGLICVYLTLLAVAGAFNVMFGWQFPGFFIDAMSSGQSKPPPLFGVVILGISLLPGVLSAALLAMVVQMIRFRRHPTVLDYAEGVFRRGRQTVCHLSDIREVCLRRITDPRYPGKAKVGLALVLHDGSHQCLEPRSGFLSRFGGSAKDPFTDLGELREGYQQEEVRCVMTAVAVQLGVPLQEREERGNLAPARGM